LVPKIFVSYRRQDSAAIAGRIFDRLRAHFGEDAIFMDIDSIPCGADFRAHISSAVDQCGVLLAVIGRKWAGDSGSDRRIDDPRDFVRIEIESGLNRNLPVIPILVDRATMPDEADLPPSLQGLVYRNAIDVDQGRDFHHHVDRLIRGIEFHFRKASSTTRDLPRHKDRPVDSKGPPSFPAKERTNSLGMTFVRVEPGEFLMGSTNEQIGHLVRLFPDSQPEWFKNELPQHAVKITRAFLLGVHAVTQIQFRKVVGLNPSRLTGADDLPVENVSWLDAVNFCNRMSVQENRVPCYQINGLEVTIVGGNGYRLPNESEWEYACRAGSATIYPFGDDKGELGEHAWYSGNADAKSHPVGRKRPNAWGFHDMLGNIWEWCADWYDGNYYRSSPPDDPQGPTRASQRVVRGGGWGDDPWVCRPGPRSSVSPGLRGSDLGFRVAAFLDWLGY
jgi:formylglycine-generating enzyme required for sulfatase activity